MVSRTVLLALLLALTVHAAVNQTTLDACFYDASYVICSESVNCTARYDLLMFPNATYGFARFQYLLRRFSRDIGLSSDFVVPQLVECDASDTYNSSACAQVAADPSWCSSSSVAGYTWWNSVLSLSVFCGDNKVFVPETGHCVCLPNKRCDTVASSTLSLVAMFAAVAAMTAFVAWSLWNTREQNLELRREQASNFQEVRRTALLVEASAAGR